LILVDTNVLLDLVTDDPLWAGWSQQQLELASANDDIVINDIVYAELSVGYARMEELDAMISNAGLAIAAIPRPALFLAGTFAGESRTAAPEAGIQQRLKRSAAHWQRHVGA
jgi:hypothetical protein